MKSELDIFATPPTQNSVEGGSTFCYRPISSLADSAPIEFIVPAAGDEYLDLAHTTLHIVAEIKNKDNKDEATELGPINNWLHSIFSQVDVFLNQKCVTPPSNNYNYRSYIENLLNYTENAKNSHLTAGLWYKDQAGQMNSKTNKGYVERKKITKVGAIELYGHLHCDIFNTDKFMINGVEMCVKLIKAKNEFHLFGDASSGHVEITDANLL